MSRRATPETDEAQHEGLLRGNPMPTKVVTANFARKLERERDDARDGFVMAVDEMVQAQSQLREAKRERAEALERERIAILSFDEERQRALREGKRVLEAKRERDEAREALGDWENAAAHVEADHPDERHCGCVPVLRKLLTDSQKERDEWAAMCGRYKQERDIAEADATNYHARIIELIDERDKTKQERDEAREELSRLYHWVERRSQDGFIDSQTHEQNITRCYDALYDRLDAAERALMEIEDRCVDGEDACDNIQKIRDIAVKALAVGQ